MQVCSLDVHVESHREALVGHWKAICRQHLQPSGDYPISAGRKRLARTFKVCRDACKRPNLTPEECQDVNDVLQEVGHPLPHIIRDP